MLNSLFLYMRNSLRIFMRIFPLSYNVELVAELSALKYLLCIYI